MIPTVSDGQERKYSGTPLSMDRSAGVIVVGDMGVTQVDRRTIAVVPSTEFVSVRRAKGPAPGGWVGAGDKRPMAIRISVWEPSGG